jgi:predicted nucleic acid-binding protein
MRRLLFTLLRRINWEVVIEGKRLGVRDAYLIENAVISGWLVVKDVINRFPIKITIHPGEADVISLAKENKIEKVLMDDAKARTAAELAGLQASQT